MEYEMSAGAFFFGLIVTVIGALGLKYYRVIADNMGSGVASYERYKLYFLIACIAGLVIALNLHTVLLRGFVNLFVG